MGDTVTVKYLWPPNFDGTATPANQPGWKRARVQMTGVSDGTGESNVKKVDISTLRKVDGSAVTSVDVEKIESNIYGFTSVVLTWDRTTDETIAVLTETGSGVDYTKSGALIGVNTGGTGDVFLTSNGATNGDSYNIVLSLLLR